MNNYILLITRYQNSIRRTPSRRRNISIQSSIRSPYIVPVVSRSGSSSLFVLIPNVGPMSGPCSSLCSGPRSLLSVHYPCHQFCLVLVTSFISSLLSQFRSLVHAQFPVKFIMKMMFQFQFKNQSSDVQVTEELFSQ